MSDPGLGVPDLEGRLLHLRSLSPDDAPALLATVDPEVWRWKLAPYPNTASDLRHVIEQHLLGPGRQGFLATRRPDGRVLGTTTLYDFDAQNQRVEMGWTWLGRWAWGQGYNEEMKYLLLRHCFEVMGLKRVAWRLDSLNLRSKNALERLGFTYEGCLRSHQLRPDGSRRDSLYYALLAEEWPRVGTRILELAEERGPR